MRWRRAVAVCVLALSTACGTPQVCSPGSSEACVGPGACAGSRRCNDEGAGFGACECSSATGGGGGSVGGGGGSTGGGSTGGGGGSTGGGDGGTGGGGGGGGGGALDAGSGPVPDIEVLPGATLDLGDVPYMANTATPIAVVGRLTVRNAGPATSVLHLGQAGAGSAPPYWSVTAVGGSNLAELCVGSFDTTTNQCTGTLPSLGAGSYQPGTGLPASSSLTVEIPVRVTATSLGLRTFEVRLYSNDPDEPVTLVTVKVNAVNTTTCSATIAPAPLDFGSLAGGATRELAFTVRNSAAAGGTSCTFAGPTLTDETGRPAGLPPVFSLPSPVPSTFVLQPGEARVIRVRAWVQGPSPAAPTPVSAKVRLYGPAGPMPLLEVGLDATLASTCLAITPATVDFGVYAPSCTAPTRTFQVANVCATNVTLGASSMPASGSVSPGSTACPGTAPCPEFELVSGPAAGTVLLPRLTGATPVTLSLKYRPLDLGPDVGAFHLATNEDGQPRTYVVPLRGGGHATGLNTETFVRGTRRADVLLVIDDSCSMQMRHQQLAANLGALLDHASVNQVDFQLGVTNTELAGSTAALAGTLHASPAGDRIFRPSTPNLTAQLGATVTQVGTNGYSESCMEPATKAVTAPYASDPAKNAGFVRPDATLGIFCLTDARDQAPLPASSYLSQLLAIKGAGNPDQLTYSVMGPFLPSSPAGCAYDDPNDGRHEELITATNGAKEEICSTDWGPALARIGTVAFGGGPSRSFPLTARPDPMATTPVTVTINGVTVPEVSPTPPNARYWSWDATTNRVVFEAFAQPAPGSTVTVSYTTACVP